MTKSFRTTLHFILVTTWRGWNYSILIYLFDNCSRPEISIFSCHSLSPYPALLFLIEPTSTWQLHIDLYIVGLPSLHQRLLMFCSLLHPQSLESCLRDTRRMTSICWVVEGINTKGACVLLGLSVAVLSSWRELGLSPSHCFLPGPDLGAGSSAFHPALTWECVYYSPSIWPWPRGGNDHSVNKKQLWNHVKSRNDVWQILQLPLAKWWNIADAL